MSRLLPRLHRLPYSRSRSTAWQYSSLPHPSARPQGRGASVRGRWCWLYGRGTDAEASSCAVCCACLRWRSARFSLPFLARSTAMRRIGERRPRSRSTSRRSRSCGTQAAGRGAVRLSQRRQIRPGCGVLQATSAARLGAAVSSRSSRRSSRIRVGDATCRGGEVARSIILSMGEDGARARVGEVRSGDGEVRRGEGEPQRRGEARRDASCFECAAAIFLRRRTTRTCVSRA